MGRPVAANFTHPSTAPILYPAKPHSSLPHPHISLPWEVSTTLEELYSAPPRNANRQSFRLSFTFSFFFELPLSECGMLMSFTTVRRRDPSNQTQARYFARQTGSRPEVGVSKIVADMKKCARNALPESGRRKRPTFEFRFVNAGEYRNKSEPHYVNDEELGLDELEPGYTRRGSQQVHLGSDEILGLTELEGTDRKLMGTCSITDC